MKNRLINSAIVLFIACACALLPSSAQIIHYQPNTIPVATSNLTFSVTTAGSDANPCTTASPCLTLQHAVNVANGYNWNNQFFPTFTIGNGAYTGVAVTLPQLFNCPLGSGGVITGNHSSPTSVLLSDNGAAWTFSLAPNSTWSIDGVDFHGTFGGISFTGTGAALTLGSLNFSGSLAQGGITEGNGVAQLQASNAVISTTTSAMGTLIYTRGVTVIDGASFTFVNPVTFTTFLFGADDVMGQIYAVGTTYTHGSNVTASSDGLIVTNGSFFESNSSSLVDGVVLTRYNFPGGAGGAKVLVDGQSTFQPDRVVGNNLFLGSTNPGGLTITGTGGNTWLGGWQGSAAAYMGTIAISDGSGVRILDYGISAGGSTNLNFTPGSNGQLVIWGGAAFNPGFELNDTLAGGTNWDFSSSSGCYSAINLTSGNFEIPLQVCSSAIEIAAVLGFNSGNEADTPDAGFSRTAAATLAFGNGTAGDTSGSLRFAAHIAGGAVPTGTTGSCSVTSFTGGKTAGKFTAPSCAGGTIILSGLPTAPNGYTCNAQDQTTSTDTLKQTANSVSSVTFLSTTAASDVVVFQCTGW